MSRSRALLFLVTTLILTSCGKGTGSNVLKAWFVDPLIKVFPNDRVGTNQLSSGQFIAARNQHVNIQIALRSTRPFSDVNAHVEGLKDSSGYAIPASAVSIRQVGYVVVGSHTPDTALEDLVGTAPGWYPDPLLPPPVTLQAGSTHCIWVEIHVPTNSPPGVYSGLIDIDADKQGLARLPFRLTVVSATVPQKSFLYVTNWFSLDDRASKQFFNVSEFSDRWWKLVANVAQVFAEHRQNVVFTPLMQLIEPKVVSGRLDYDFSKFDRWVQTFQAAGAIGYIEGSHLLTRPYYQASLGVQVFEREGNKVVTKTLPPDCPEVTHFLTDFLSALNKHLSSKGWKSIYLQHVLDEAHGTEIPYYGKVATLVHRYLPGVPTIDAINPNDLTTTIRNNSDIWVPVLGARLDKKINLIEQRIQSDHPVWYYVDLGPRGNYLNRFIDFPLIKTRLLPWLDFRYGFSGFLQWGGNYWTPKPMLDTQPVINDNRTFLPAGDAFIYYPDRENLTFYSSIRMEAFLTGVEDYELLHVLGAKHPTIAKHIGDLAISSVAHHVRSPVTFRKIETQLLTEASKP